VPAVPLLSIRVGSVCRFSSTEERGGRSNGVSHQRIAQLTERAEAPRPQCEGAGIRLVTSCSKCVQHVTLSSLAEVTSWERRVSVDAPATDATASEPDWGQRGGAAARAAGPGPLTRSRFRPEAAGVSRAVPLRDSNGDGRLPGSGAGRSFGPLAPPGDRREWGCCARRRVP
jgi:hypothetical protein